MKTPTSCSSFSNSDKGYVAFLAMLMIAFFGLLAGTHSLVVMSLASSARGMDEASDRHLFEDRLELVVAETLARMWETQHGSPMEFQTCLARNLERLQVPDIETRVSSLSSWAGFPEEPPPAGGSAGRLSPPSVAFRSLAGPSLRHLAGELVAETPEGRVTFASEHGQGRLPKETTIGFRFVSVPVIHTPHHAYILPDELASSPVSSLEEGVGVGAFTSGPGGEAVQDFLGEEASTLPYRFRRQASLASAYAGVFSNAFVSRALISAGPGLVHRLDLEETSTARLAGLTRKDGCALFDIGLAGGGEFSGRHARGNVLVLASAQSGLELVLGQVSDTEHAPLVLLVIGPPKGTVIVKLAPCARPVLLIAMHATLLPLGGDWVGGLLLGPDCRVVDTGHPMRVAHLSHAAGGPPVPEGLLQASLEAPSALLALSPRVGYVVTEVLAHAR